MKVTESLAWIEMRIDDWDHKVMPLPPTRQDKADYREAKRPKARPGTRVKSRFKKRKATT